MIDMHWQMQDPACLRGAVRYAENGRCLAPGCHAVAAGALLGIHLSLPRCLGALDLRVCLRAEGEADVRTLPLTFVATDGVTERYAALLDTARLAPVAGYYTCRVLGETVYGAGGFLAQEGEAVQFSPSCAGQEGAIPLYLYQPARTCPPPPGGVVYEQPTPQAEKGEAQPALSALVPLGVSFLLWRRPAGERGATVPTVEHLLPPAWVGAARAHSMAVWPDLLWAIGAQTDDTLLAEPDPAAYLHQDFAGSPCIVNGVQPVENCRHITGEDGVVARLARAGAGGFFLRAATRFGDAFLSTLHDAVQDALPGQGILAGALPGEDLFCPAAGTRHRYVGGEELDSICSPCLREALLAYLREGETAPLYHYLVSTLPTLPPQASAFHIHLLSDAQGNSVSTALQGEGAEELFRLAYLVAGTLPGLLAITAGDETDASVHTAGHAPGERDARRAFFLRLCALRQQEPAYHGGTVRLYALRPDMLAYARETEGETCLTVINRAATPLRISAAEEFTVIFSGRGRKDRFDLPARTGCVLRLSTWQGERAHITFTRPPAKRPSPPPHRQKLKITQEISRQSVV